MIKKFSSLMLIGLVLNLFLYSTANAVETEKAAKFALKVKSEISRLGTGKDANIKVKLRDKTKLSGYVSEIGESDFTIIERQTSQPVQIPYSQVKKAAGKNNLTGEQLLLGVVGAALVIGLIAMIVHDTGI